MCTVTEDQTKTESKRRPLTSFCFVRFWKFLFVPVCRHPALASWYSAWEIGEIAASPPAAHQSSSPAATKSSRRARLSPARQSRLNQACRSIIRQVCQPIICPGHRLWLSQAAPKSSSLGRYEVSLPIVALSSPPATAHSSLPVDHQSRSPAACQSSSTAATKLSPPVVAHSSLPVDHQSSLSADHLKSSLPAAPTSGPLAAAHFSSRVSSSIVTARSAVNVALVSRHP